MDSIWCTKCGNNSHGYINGYCVDDGADVLFLANWAILVDNIAMRPIGDRILIREDEFKSRYDCLTCGGKGHLDDICPRCLGKKYVISKVDKEESACPECTVNAERTISYGKVLCPVCHGNKGSLVIPEDSQKPPTTGIIIAVGKEVTEYKVGARVLYHNFTGTAFEMFKTKLRIMRQGDVYCEIRGMTTEVNEVKNVEIEESGVV